jgi:hypothetical protein
MFTQIRLKDFRQQYPRFLPAVLLILAVLIAIDSLLVERQGNYDREIDSLRSRMSDVQRRRGDAMEGTRDEQQKIMLELVRRQAMWGRALHLSIDLDSTKMALMQEGAVLRAFPIEIAAERRLRPLRVTEAATVPRGADSVARVLGPTDAWRVPRWVYADRRLSVPADSMIVGALGNVAIVLGSGTVIYSRPTTGPLRDSAYVLPGAVRASEEELRAIVANLVPGTPVYIY